jgi:uncharacterized membrane protein YhfC
LSACERLWTAPIQVALSVIVLQVLRRGRLIWLLWTVPGHAVVDLVAVGLQQLLGTCLTSRANAGACQSELPLFE